MSRGSFDDFLDSMRAFESGVDYDRFKSGQISEAQIRQWVGENNWQAYQSGDLTWEQMQYKSMNSLGFVGYQFGEALLIDLGYYKDDVYYGNGAATNTWDGTFTGKNGIHSLDDLKTDLQEHVIRDAFGYNLNVIKAGLAASGKSLDDFIGQDFTYQDTNGAQVTVTLSMTGILAASHLRGAWGTLALLQNGSSSADENGTSILKYIQQFGGYDAPTAQQLIDHFQNGPGQNDVVVPETTPETPPTADEETHVINWDWGTQKVLQFDPATDKLDFGFMGADAFDLSQTDAGVLITVVGNAQTYLLQGIDATDLNAQHFLASDLSALAEIDQFLI